MLDALPARSVIRPALRTMRRRVVLPTVKIDAKYVRVGIGAAVAGTLAMAFPPIAMLLGLVALLALAPRLHRISERAER